MARRGYPTDLTDAQWAVLEPLLPAVRTRGRPRRTDLRAVVDAILYVLRTGCAWRHLPHEFPPWSTVHRWFLRLSHTGVFEPWPFLARCYVDRAYTGKRVATATSVALTVVGAPKGQKGFAVHPRRWVIERTIGWLGRCRRLARDHEATPASAVAFVLAAAMILVRRVARTL